MIDDYNLSDQEAADLALVAQVMSDTIPLPVVISIVEAWLLISGLQLAWRHPGLSPYMKRDLESIGRQFQEAILARHPDAGDLIERGWNPDFDV